MRRVQTLRRLRANLGNFCNKENKPRKCFRHKTPYNFYRAFSLLLLAAFLLVSCEPPASPSAPRKKTEALQALEDATEEFGNAVSKEIDAREAYVAAVPAGQKVETAMWRLLRRMVVLGQKASPDELKRLLQEWRDAKKSSNR